MPVPWFKEILNFDKRKAVAISNAVIVSEDGVLTYRF